MCYNAGQLGMVEQPLVCLVMNPSRRNTTDLLAQQPFPPVDDQMQCQNWRQLKRSITKPYPCHWAKVLNLFALLFCRRSTVIRYMCLSHLFRSLLLAAAAPNLTQRHDGSCGVFQHVIHSANRGGRQREALVVANCVGIAANIEQAFQSAH
jgi:hypothetical protein